MSIRTPACFSIKLRPISIRSTGSVPENTRRRWGAVVSGGFARGRTVGALVETMETLVGTAGAFGRTAVAESWENPGKVIKKKGANKKIRLVKGTSFSLKIDR